jgi:hypothetical protein
MKMLTKISKMLDTIADSLEKKGFTREASEIDIIANTVEASTKKTLKKVLEDAKLPIPPEAKKFLDVDVYWNLYNSNWRNSPADVEWAKEFVRFQPDDKYNYPQLIVPEMHKMGLVFVDNKWEIYSPLRNKKHTKV